MNELPMFVHTFHRSVLAKSPFCHENPPSIDPFIGDVSKQKHASTNHAAIKMDLDVGNIRCIPTSTNKYYTSQDGAPQL